MEFEGFLKTVFGVFGGVWQRFFNPRKTASEMSWPQAKLKGIVVLGSLCMQTLSFVDSAKESFQVHIDFSH